MFRRILAVCAVFAVYVPAASAGSSPVQVLSPEGRTIASGGPGAFEYPPGSGFTVRVGSSSVTRNGVRLSNVSLLGGRVQALTVFLPRNGRAARVKGLYVDGKVIDAKVNRLIPLSGTDYMITSQAAVANGHGVGRVGLRLSLGSAGYGLKAGSQVLVGLPAAPRPAGHRSNAASTASPLEMLGFIGDGPGVVGPAPLPFFSGGSIGRRAVAIAGRYLGVPYLWGGASPVTGFDCSGLAMYVYAQLGIQLTHYTGTQIHQGMPVPRSMLQPGDLVFFFPHNGVPDHEGIYIGHGKFIQAPHTGDVVKISSLSDPSYGFGYVGAVRPYRL